MSEPWLERWAEGRTGFHEADGNAALKEHWRGAGLKVLVPLCGKTRDLLWLAQQGNSVVGVELAEVAVRGFFVENGLAYERSGDAFRATDIDITIYCGDYFAFDDGPFDAHYDRAALVALPPSLRPGYVRRTNGLLEPGARQLVITIEYDPSLVEGPPFSVPGDEVRGYWPGLERVDEHDDGENSPPRFRAAGAAVSEVIWRSRER